MMSLNGMDLLQYESIDEIMAVLIEATWPKGFQFRRPRNVDNKSNEPKTSAPSNNKEGAATATHTDKILSSTKMTIVSPPILFGMTYNFQVAKFGNRQVIDCTERKVVFFQNRTRLANH